jgi:hypothetical protein
MIIAFSILLVGLIAWLWYEGGGKNAWARDIIIPILVGVWFCFRSNWIVGIMTAGACQIIRLGYGAYDPEHDDKPSLLAKLTKDRNGWWIRAISGAIHGIFGPLFIVAQEIFIKHNPGAIAWKYPAFIAVNAFSNFLVCRLRCNRLVTDLVVGAVFALIVYL